MSLRTPSGERLLIGVTGLELTPEDRERLHHPTVAGAILFSRNYAEIEQLVALVAAIKALRNPPLLVCVDHEGGRVQRFQAPFTALPAACRYGITYDRAAVEGLTLAQSGGWLMAAELRAVGVDFSFAPVLDLDWGQSEVMAGRAFHRDPAVVAALAGAFMAGMAQAGMACVVKHFPGHGWVAADSHHELPIDAREKDRLYEADLIPFSRLAATATAVMPAHVIYSAIDPRPAGFSARWLGEILRHELGFKGLIISDDLDMAAAAAIGSPSERAAAALESGCDLMLACNDFTAAEAMMAAIASLRGPTPSPSLAPLRGGAPPAACWRELSQLPQRQRAVEQLAALAPLADASGRQSMP